MMKFCYKCNQKKPLDAFGKNRSRKDGLSTECKPCKKQQDKQYYAKNADAIKAVVAEYRIKNPEKTKLAKQKAVAKKKIQYQQRKNAILAKYRASKLQATPLWFEKEKIKVLYQKAKLWGFEVDHIVPLKSKNVCGLHCWSNLQLLDPMVNVTKGNRHWPDMP